MNTSTPTGEAMPGTSADSTTGEAKNLVLSSGMVDPGHRTPRPMRHHEGHHWGGAALDLTDELRRLAIAYEDCPGIAHDLRTALADLHRRRAADRRSA